MSKRNAALEALGGAPAPATPPKAPPAAPAVAPVAQAAAASTEKVVSLPTPAKTGIKATDKVMLYLPPKVARKFKEMAFHEDCKAHDLYLRALDGFLRQEGHAAEADLLKR